MPDPIFDGVFDEQFAPGAHVGVAGGDYTLTPTEYKDGIAFTIVGQGLAGRAVNIPSGIGKMAAWRADPAGTFSVFIRCGSSSVEIAPGDRLAVVTDKQGRIRASLLGQAVGSSAWRTVAAADSPVTLLAGGHYDFDTSAGAITGTLPVSPDKFDEIFIRNSSQSFVAHALTIGRNGETIMDLAQDMTVNTDGADFSLWFNGETWQLPGAQL